MKRPGMVKPPRHSPAIAKVSGCKQIQQIHGTSIHSISMHHNNCKFKEYTDLPKHIFAHTLDTPDTDIMKLNNPIDCGCFHELESSSKIPIEEHIQRGLLGDSPKRSSVCCLCANQQSNELESILAEIRFLTNRMRREDEVGDIVAGKSPKCFMI